MKIDYEKIVKEMIKQSCDNANLASLGYLLTDSSLCEYHVLNILVHMKDVSNEISNKQYEKLLEMYNFLIVQR